MKGHEKVRQTKNLKATTFIDYIRKASTYVRTYVHMQPLYTNAHTAHLHFKDNCVCLVVSLEVSS